jgi:hypothetical protein
MHRVVELCLEFDILALEVTEWYLHDGSSSMLCVGVCNPQITSQYTRSRQRTGIHACIGVHFIRDTLHILRCRLLVAERQPIPDAAHGVDLEPNSPG